MFTDRHKLEKEVAIIASQKVSERGLHPVNRESMNKPEFTVLCIGIELGFWDLDTLGVLDPVHVLNTASGGESGK